MEVGGRRMCRLCTPGMGSSKTFFILIIEGRLYCGLDYYSRVDEHTTGVVVDFQKHQVICVERIEAQDPAGSCIFVLIIVIRCGSCYSIGEGEVIKCREWVMVKGGNPGWQKRGKIGLKSYLQTTARNMPARPGHCWGTCLFPRGVPLPR